MRDIELTKAYQRSKLDVTGQLLKDKVILDIYRRLGNIVLYQVREIRKEQEIVHSIFATGAIRGVPAFIEASNLEIK